MVVLGISLGLCWGLAWIAGRGNFQAGLGICGVLSKKVHLACFFLLWVLAGEPKHRFTERRQRRNEAEASDEAVVREAQADDDLEMRVA